jgi:hypothetical protein
MIAALKEEVKALQTKIDKLQEQNTATHVLGMRAKLVPPSFGVEVYPVLVEVERSWRATCHLTRRFCG